MEQPDLSAIDHATRNDLIRFLLAENAELKSRIATLEIRLDKNHHNSNKPPSSVGLHKLSPKSLRQAGQRAKGGQKGSGLEEQFAIPDHVVIHPLPVACDACGGALAEVTEHRILEEHAAPAVKCTGAAFQKALQPPRNMGLRVQATIVYLTQHRSDRISRACFHPLDGIAAFSGGIPSVGDEVAVPLVNSCHIYALQHHVDLYIFTNNKLHSGSTTVLYYEVRHVAIFID